jgi:hypothetical protein
LRDLARVRAYYLKDPPGLPLRVSHLFLPRLPSKEPHPLNLNHFKIPFVILRTGSFLAALAFIREMALLLSATFAILRNTIRFI